MIIILAATGFLFLMVGIRFLLRDFTLFIWRRTTAINVPDLFVDFGEHITTFVVVAIISTLGLFFYKFAISLTAYLISDGLIDYFITVRGVFLPGSDLRSPFDFRHLISGLLLTPALQFVTFYFIHRGIRTFMFTINRKYNGTPYTESDVLYFGFISTLVFILLEILFYTQNIPTVSSVAHTTYLAVSRMSVIAYYLAIAHIHLLRDEKYRASLPTYFKLTGYESGIIYSPLKTVVLTYVIGIVLYLPFFTGVQFLKSNLLLILIYFLSWGVFYVIMRFFLSKAFNYVGVVMLAENTGMPLMEKKIFQVKGEKKILQVIIIITALLALIKLKSFLIALFSAILFFALFVTALCVLYLFGLGGAVARSRIKKIPRPQINASVILDYLKTSVKGTLNAGTLMVGLILFVFALFSIWPKKFKYEPHNYVSAVLDEQGNPLLIESTGKNDVVGVTYNQVPEFVFKCLFLQEDRSFEKQDSWLPQKSNWHGISPTMIWRFITGGGGSNINMQLIKNVAFDGAFPQDVQRKFSETLAAYQLSLQCSKQEIATRYLNEAGFNGGNGQQGIMAGSLYTFGLPIHELNSLEIMYLIATLKRATQFRTGSGLVAYKDAASHQPEIKEALLQQAAAWHAQGLLSTKEMNNLKQQELRFTNRKYHPDIELTTRDFLTKEIKEDENRNMIYKSSISKEAQQQMSRAVKEFDQHLQGQNQVGEFSLYSSAIAVDVKTGKIIAHYGGKGLSDMTRFASGNQVGSVIKPFLIQELLEMGFTRDKIQLYDGPVKGKRTPQNYSGRYSNTYMGIDEILAKSPNAPMVNIRQITDPIPLFKSVELRFTEMDIPADKYLKLDDPKKKQENELNYPLGSRNMTLFEIAQAYQALFNKGKFISLCSIDSGFNPGTNQVTKSAQQQLQIYSEDKARQIVSALGHTMQAGGTGAHLTEILPKGRSFFAKTGTSDESRHGYTVLCDGEVLIVAYVSYGKVVGNHLSLGMAAIPNGSGGRSAGVLAALVYKNLLPTIKNL